MYKYVHTVLRVTTSLRYVTACYLADTVKDLFCVSKIYLLPYKKLLLQNFCCNFLCQGYVLVGYVLIEVAEWIDVHRSAYQ